MREKLSDFLRQTAEDAARKVAEQPRLAVLLDEMDRCYEHLEAIWPYQNIWREMGRIESISEARREDLHYLACWCGFGLIDEEWRTTSLGSLVQFGHKEDCALLLARHLVFHAAERGHFAAIFSVKYPDSFPPMLREFRDQMVGLADSLRISNFDMLAKSFDAVLCFFKEERKGDS